MTWIKVKYLKYLLKKNMFVSFRLFDVYFHFRFQWKGKKSKIKFVRSKFITDEEFLGSIKTEEFIKAHLFVIPHPACTLDDCLDKTRVKKIMQACGVPIANWNTEKLVHVWFCTPGNPDSNWVDHRIDGYDELRGWKPLMGLLPTSIFKGKDDGDAITIDLPITNKLGIAYERNKNDWATVKVQLILDQKNHRYKTYGSFAETLKKLGC